MEKAATVYIETTIPSYLTARPSSNLIIAGEQLVTSQWSESRKSGYHLYISELVVEEAGRGNAEASQRRLEVIADIDELEIDEATISLTNKLLATGIFPEKAAADAGHIAIASRHGVDYLLTWNCKHIANAEFIRRISYEIGGEGYFVPIICTPRELFGDKEDEE